MIYQFNHKEDNGLWGPHCVETQEKIGVVLQADIGNDTVFLDEILDKYSIIYSSSNCFHSGTVGHGIEQSFGIETVISLFEIKDLTFLN